MFTSFQERSRIRDPYIRILSLEILKCFTQSHSHRDTQTPRHPDTQTDCKNTLMNTQHTQTHTHTHTHTNVYIYIYKYTLTHTNTMMETCGNGSFALDVRLIYFHMSQRIVYISLQESEKEKLRTGRKITTFSPAIWCFQLFYRTNPLKIGLIDVKLQIFPYPFPAIEPIWG